METLSPQFDQALSSIEIDDTKRRRVTAAHQEVRGILESSQRLRAWGIDTILIGSYARNTGIFPGKDADVFAKLTLLDTHTSPDVVFNEVWQVLAAHYGKRAKRQHRSIRIEFDDFHVDAVPAVRSGRRWAIPNRDPQQWTHEEDRWIDTDPERLTGLTAERNRHPVVGSRGAYVPTVKLIRQIRGHHLGDLEPGGLYLEMCTYWAFEGGVSGESFAEILAATLRSVAQILDAALVTPVRDPAMGSAYAPQPERRDLEHAAEVFSRLASEAERALLETRCQAAAIWRHVIGRNRRGWCFPLPPGCDEQGREIPAVTPNRGRGSNEARPFA